MHYLPELNFQPDDSLERGMRIDQLLDSLHDETSKGESNVE